jgi:hypothetical protein
MKKKLSIQSHLGCFGNFNIGDSICRRHCCLSLRCAIEREQNEQLEILEDLAEAEEMVMKVN